MADEVVLRHRFNDFTEWQQKTLVSAAVRVKTKQATDFWWDGDATEAIFYTF